MKKRIVCMLALLAMLVTAFPFAATTASAAEPTAYEDLYVQEGLQSLYYAYDSKDVDLEAGIWQPRIGQKAAELTGGAAWWKAGQKGGVGYTMTVDQWKADATKVGITLPSEALPGKDYTVQTVFTATGITNEDGTRYTDPKPDPLPAGGYWGLYKDELFAFSLGGLHSLQFMASASMNLMTRWTYTTGTRWDPAGTYWVGGRDESFIDGLDFNTVATYTIMHDYSDPSDGKEYPHSQYRMYGGMGQTFSFDNYTDSKKACQTYIDPTGKPFQILHGFPTTVYSIRIYDRVLTDEERYQNHFVDMCAYFQLDLTKYMALPEFKQTAVVRAFAMLDFTADPALLQQTLDDTGSGSGNNEPMHTLEDTLYVTDGLTMWLDATDKASITNTVDLLGGKWYSKVGDGVATLTGGMNIWKAGEKDGLGFRLSGAGASGINFGIDNLPTGNYTFEMLLDPIGFTKADGSPVTFPASESYGIETGVAFALGGLKGEGFPALSEAPGAVGYSHEVRWFYIGQGDWPQFGAAYGWNTMYNDSSMKANHRFNYTITMTEGKDDSGQPMANYCFFSNATEVVASTVTSDRFVKPADSDGRFLALQNFPADVFSVRVYNRVLTPEEISQNHTADLIYFYDLDLTFYNVVKANLDKEGMGRLYRCFDVIDFSLTKEEAQQIFDSQMTGVWLNSAGVSVRVDDTIGIRGEFDMESAAIAGMEANGYTVEVGALLNIGGTEYPTLEKHAYKLTARNADGTLADSLFIGENGAVKRFAVAVLFGNPTKQMCVDNCYFTGYITLTDSEGKVRTMYCNIETVKYRPNIFSSYNYIMSQDAYDSNAFVKKTVEGCYAVENIYLSESGKDSNSGTADAPLRSLAQAIVKMKELMDSATPVNITVYMEEGSYYVTETLKLAHSDSRSGYYRIQFVGEEGARITGEVPMDPDYFNASAGGYDFWMADAIGEVSDFRFLYVDGKQAELAHEGITRQDDGPQYLCTENFESPSFGVYRIYLPLEMVEPLRPYDYHNCELHIRVQWEYKIMHIIEVDFSDLKSEGDNTLVACYLDPNEMKDYASSLSTWENRVCWLANHRAFLDEPGEYYYDEFEGAVYWLPEEGQTPENTAVSFGGVECLINFDGVKNLTFSGLTFTGTDNYYTTADGYHGTQAGYELWQPIATPTAALYVKDADKLTVENCLFEELAGDGVMVENTAYNVSIVSNRFFEMGMAAIRLGNSNSLKCEDLLITDNYIDGTGNYYKSVPAVVVHSAKDAEISYNTIFNSSYSALSIGWGWGQVSTELSEVEDRYNLLRVTIAYNYINNYMTDMDDGGGIYTLGGNVNKLYTDDLNFWEMNLIVNGDRTGDADEGHTATVMPYYHDGASSNWRDTGNVLVLNPKYKVFVPYYIQNISGQEVFNVHLEDTYIVNLKLNVSGNGRDWDILNDVFGFAPVFSYKACRVDIERNITESRTIVIEDKDNMFTYPDVAAVFANAGSSYRMPETEDLAEIPSAMTYVKPEEPKAE